MMTEDNPFGGVTRARAPIRSTPVRQTPVIKLTAKPNWENMDATDEEDSGDVLNVPRDLMPEDMDLQWVADTVHGQPSDRRGGFERRGWTPVHQADFDGQFDGRWMPRGVAGEINYKGLVLMTRPRYISDEARLRQTMRANRAVQLKRDALVSGDVPGINLDTRHPTAVRQNKVNRTVEPLSVPDFAAKGDEDF